MKFILVFAGVLLLALERLLGVGARRSVVIGSLVLGAALVVAMLPFPSPFALPAGAG